MNNALIAQHLELAMQEQHSKVNFRKLVDNLAAMYGEDTFDVVLSELVANSLDAKPSEILVDWDKDRRILVVTDDGIGMDAESFAQYHDFATELKSRGDGIGFAGIGAKISFNIADRVMTETRHSGTVSSSDWRWYDDGSLRWYSVEPNHLKYDGTRVEVHFEEDTGLQYVNDEYLLTVLRRHYLPLLITDFLRAYEAIGMYRVQPRFILNGSPVNTQELNGITAFSQSKHLELQSGTQAIGWGVIGVSDRDRPIDDTTYGILLCTHGKVIKPELFGLSTGVLGAKLFGIVEIPELIQFLTTNKSDLKAGPRRMSGLNRLLDPVREELRNFLAQHGVVMVGQQRNQLTAKLERELSRMVRSLPELQDFDGLLRRSRRLRKSLTGDLLTSDDKRSAGDREDEENRRDENGIDDISDGGSSRSLDSEGKTRAKRQRSRNNQGPRVAFEEHTDREETAWIESNTVVINSGHRAYRQRINQDQARLTYCMFAIGVALDKSELVESADGASYVDKFIAAWGR